MCQYKKRKGANKKKALAARGNQNRHSRVKLEHMLGGDFLLIEPHLKVLTFILKPSLRTI